jgi:hypothetical protein
MAPLALLPQIAAPSLAHAGPRRAGPAPRFVPRAAPDGMGEPPAGDAPSTGSPPPAARIVTTPPPGRSFPPPPPGAMNPDLQLRKVEKLGSASIEGVAKVERSDDNTAASLPRALALAAGDTAALLLFATIGRFNHHEALTLAGSFETAAPFLIGWFATAPFLGGFSKKAQGGDVGAAVGAAAKSWAAAIPLGIVIRSVLRGYTPDKAFIIVSFVATAVMLLGWRAAAASLAPQEAGEKTKKKTKKGNPFEFFTLLFGLVKRW